MDSPNGNRVAATSSPSSGKSPAVQESPFSNFLSNLSPINSLKPVRYTQRLLETNLPIPPPVFTSPHRDLQRETSFLERDNIVAADSNFHEQCNTQLNAVKISNLEKEVQSCRSSGCVGEYLANPVEVDGVTSANPCLQSTKEVCQLLQSGYTGSKDTIKKIDDAVDSTREAGGFTSLDQAENKLPLSSLKVVESAVTLRNDERFDEFLKFTSEKNNAIVVSDMSLDPVSGVQHCGRYAAQNVGAKLDDRNGTCQSFPEPLQINEACENSDESSRRLSKENFKEASYHQHGTRRHLHFEADIACKSVATGNTANSRDSLTNLKNVVLSHGERRTISSSWESVSYGQSITSQSSFCPFEVVRSTQTSGNAAILSALPSGIGLHVNSIGRSVCLDSDMFASKNSTGYLSSQDKLVPERSNVVTKDPNSISISAVARTMFSHAIVDQQESQAGVGATLAINSLHPPCDSFSSTQIEQQVASGEGRMSTSQNADSVEELKQVSPTRRRKRTANKSESDGCKLCNCKRSKCLKLYCECFATGVYCVDSCACENCFNKPEYDDLVLDTRQQIESRNPLAFTPKIITHATDSLENVMEEGNWNTPSSARHKRGCNCKKSKCLKRYCECYQAKVGCSDGCRCEGCQNSFGKKADLTQDRSMEQCSPTWEELTELNSSLHDIMEDDDIPAILKDTTFTALRAVKASSPNQKQVFPPRFQSERQRSSSPPGLRCGRKLSLQAVPSFPSLTPYSNSKESVSLFRNDQTDSIDNH